MPRISIQILAVLALAFLLFLGWDFSQRVILTIRLRQTEQELDQQIARVEATRSALQEQKKQVQTDAFVEEKVRRDLHYVRDGETLVIAQITPAAPPPADPLTSRNLNAAPQASWWQDLLDFLFGP